MENLILFIIIFVIFFIGFLIDFLIKKKKKTLKKFIGVELVKAHPKDYERIGILLIFINSFIISVSGTVCTMIDMDKVWQLLYGFVLLTALIYAFYGIIRNYLEFKYKKRGRKK